MTENRRLGGSDQPVSVVMVARNRSELLRPTLTALVAQFAPGDQLIVVDDASTEDLLSIVAEVSPEADFIRVERHEGYKLATRINQGLDRARNDMVWRLDADCIPRPGTLQRAREWFSTYRLLAGGIYCRDESGSCSAEDHQWRTSLLEALRLHAISEYRLWEEHRRIFRPHACFGGNAFFSKTVVDAIGGFDTIFDGGWGGEDTWFATKAMLQAGCTLYLVPELAVEHQYHEQIGGHRDSQMRTRNLHLLAVRNATLRSTKPRTPPLQSRRDEAHLAKAQELVLLSTDDDGTPVQSLTESILAGHFGPSLKAVRLEDAAAGYSKSRARGDALQSFLYVGDELFTDIERLEPLTSVLSPARILLVNSGIARLAGLPDPVVSGLPIDVIPADRYTNEAIASKIRRSAVAGPAALLHLLRSAPTQVGKTIALGLPVGMSSQDLALVGEFCRRQGRPVVVLAENDLEVAQGSSFVARTRGADASVRLLPDTRDFAQWVASFEDLGWVVSHKRHHLLWALASGRAVGRLTSPELSRSTPIEQFFVEQDVPAFDVKGLLRLNIDTLPNLSERLSEIARCIEDAVAASGASPGNPGPH